SGTAYPAVCHSLTPDNEALTPGVYAACDAGRSASEAGGLGACQTGGSNDGSTATGSPLQLRRPARSTRDAYQAYPPRGRYLSPPLALVPRAARRSPRAYGRWPP